MKPEVEVFFCRSEQFLLRIDLVTESERTEARLVFRRNSNVLSAAIESEVRELEDLLYDAWYGTRVWPALRGRASKVTMDTDEVAFAAEALSKRLGTFTQFLS